MDFKNTHFRSYVYTGFKLGKSINQLYMELQEVHKDHSAPSLRTIHYWVNSTKDGSFKLEKKVSSGRPRSSRSPKLIEEVNKLITEDPRLSTYQLD